MIPKTAVVVPRDVREPIEDGPSRPAETPGRSRVAAAVVAFAVFAAAGAFAWRALGPADEDGTPLVADAPARVVVTLTESGPPDHFPSGTLTIGENTVESAHGSFGWCDADGCGIADVTIPEFDEYVPVPIGAELLVETTARKVTASIGDPEYPFENAVPIELSDGIGTLNAELGRHGLVFDVRWEDGESYLEAPLYFPIELVEAGQPSPTPVEEPSRLYEANAFVLDEPDRAPVMCLGGVNDSLPPQCDGLPLASWDWNVVDGEESASGTTWGSFHVVGTYDGTTFTLTDVGPEEIPPPKEGDQFAAPCPEPDGGWVAPDPARATDADLQAVMHAAEREPDSAGFWIDHVGEPSESTPAQEIIAVAAFTGDLERHEAELRQLWGGPLCVTRHERTQAELHRIQAEIGSVLAELGLQVTWSGDNVMQNRVEVGVVVADEEARAAVDARYGAGAVLLVPALTPLAQSG